MLERVIVDNLVDGDAHLARISTQKNLLLVVKIDGILGCIRLVSNRTSVQKAIHLQKGGSRRRISDGSVSFDTVGSELRRRRAEYIKAIFSSSGHS